MVERTTRQELQSKIDQCKRLSVVGIDPTTSSRLVILLTDLERQLRDLPE